VLTFGPFHEVSRRVSKSPFDIVPAALVKLHVVPIRYSPQLTEMGTGMLIPLIVIVSEAVGIEKNASVIL